MFRGMHLASTLLFSGVWICVLLLGVISIAAAQEEPTRSASPNALRVNELMASNGSTLVDSSDPDRTPDWIEIYNTADVAVSLQGLAVSDDPSRPTKHIITATLTVPAKGFLILFADNAPQRGPQHLDFALSRQGESFGIYQIDGSGNATPIDEVTFPELGRDVAYARSIDGSGVWGMARPTPGKSNTIDPPWISQVTLPNVSPEQPAPTAPFTVSAVITDNIGVAAASLFYMTATAPFTDLSAPWIALPMTAVGADRYEAVIPGAQTGTLVRYYVEASDTDGDSARLPTLPGSAYAYLSGYQPPRLLLSKVVSRNDIMPDPDEPGEYPDWVEVYNPGASPVSMDGLSITNRRSQPLLFPLPSGIIVPPGARLTLLIDGDVGQNLSKGSDLIWHVGSGNVMNRLENNGDYVGIFGGQGTIVVDEFDWDERPRWGAFGRVPVGGEWSDRVCTSAMNAPNLLCDQEVFLPSVQR